MIYSLLESKHVTYKSVNISGPEERNTTCVHITTSGEKQGAQRNRSCYQRNSYWVLLLLGLLGREFEGISFQLARS